MEKASFIIRQPLRAICPECAPFGAVNELEDKLYIQTGKVKPTSHQLAANPGEEICSLRVR